MSHIQDRVRKVITEQLSPGSPESVVPAAHLADDLGEDSLDRVELVMALEQEFELDIPDDDAEKWVTVGDVVEYISQRPEVRAVA